MEQTKIPTQFAPPERASAEMIHHQAQYFLNLPLVNQLFNAVPDIVLILNEQRQIIVANNNLLKVLGLNSEETLLGLRPGEALNCIHAFEVEGGCGTSEFCESCGAVQAILSSLRGKETIQECRITQRSGAALDLQVWATPLRLGNEQFSIFAVKDISAEKRRQALERVFFHDLLNAAGGLQGFAYLLQDAGPNDLESIRASISKLSKRLIDEINAQQELSLAESNELTVHPSAIETLTFLQEIVELYQNHEVARDRYLRLAPNARAALFISDPTLLRRVIGNMVKNALEASKPGETVSITCAVHKAKIEFRVHNPHFMPRSTQLQVFQRSFSTKGLGRGLGTYSIRLLSERYLKGKVSFTSSRQKGTTFKACYPLILRLEQV